MTIETLNEAFGLDGQLTFVAGEGGFPTIRIDNGLATASISVYAGQVLAYCPADQREDLLFVSRAAFHADGKAIKGGIPVCWPWFGPDPENRGRPAHGFVRNRAWNVLATAATDDGGTRVSLGFEASDATRALWPYAFDLTLDVLVGRTLEVTLVTRNRGDEPLVLTQALHTYFRIGDIDRVTVLGLDGTDYLDKAADGGRRHQAGAVTVAGEVDRIYTGVRYPLTLEDRTFGRRIRIHADGSRTAVVWNPWRDIAAGMADLEDSDYTRFLCVETANAADDSVQVPPGDACRLHAGYSIEHL